jgi:hypothetical protein
MLKITRGVRTDEGDGMKSRRIIKCNKIKYLPDNNQEGTYYQRARCFSAGPFSPPIVYVEGYVQISEDDILRQHAWLFDPVWNIAYELQQLDGLTSGEVFQAAYYGYEIAQDEWERTPNSPVLSDKDLKPIKAAFKKFKMKATERARPI